MDVGWVPPLMTPVEDTVNVRAAFASDDSSVLGSLGSPCPDGASTAYV